MSAGRNDPCPCGSGLKYKKCHLPIDEAARPVVREPMRSTLHDFDNRFVENVFIWALQRFGEEVGPDALEEAYPEVAQAGLELLVPWAVYHHEVDGLAPFEWYARENEPMLSRRERDWIEAQRRSWLSVWEVRESVPGKSMLLADLLTGEQRLVQEASASRLLVARDAILARVVDLGAESILAGTHRRPLAPRDAADAVEELRRHFRAPLPLPAGRLRDEDATRAVIGIWHYIVEEADERRARPPRLQNTDGDPIRMVMDRYAFAQESRDAVEAALASIVGAGAIEEGDDDGVHSITFQKDGNRTHAHWDNTVVGRAYVTADGELRLETNSRRRATALRKKVEKACGGLLTGRRREEIDALEMLQAARDDAAAGDDDDAVESTSPAEDDALIREEKRLHYAAWLDLPLPILGNRTPRRAARNSKGREELAILLKDLENREARQPAGVRFDVGVLRRELGIEE